MCPDTDPRTQINEEGCPYDSDGDGIFEGIDECPATPQGAVVDERGCRVDTDGDGVADGLDKCPDTSPEAEVDETGCSWVQKGKIVLPTIRFGAGSANLAPGSSPALNEVAEILKQNPDVTVEIGGHTDNEGPARLNRKISLERADEVKRYLAARGVPHRPDDHERLRRGPSDREQPARRGPRAEPQDRAKGYSHPQMDEIDLLYIFQ